MKRLLTITKLTLAWAVIGALGLMWMSSAACPENQVFCLAEDLQ
jgi:hypothetical protein